MPEASLCNTPGCGTLIPPGQRHCHQHRKAANATKQRTNDARRRRDGRNRATWQHTRRIVLERAGHTCELHLDHACTTAATSIHRINGGYHDTNPDHYLAACPHCHGTIDGNARKPTHQTPTYA